MVADPHTPHPRVHRLAVSLRRLALGTSGVRWRGVCAVKGRGVGKGSVLGAEWPGSEVRFPAGHEVRLAGVPLP